MEETKKHIEEKKVESHSHTDNHGHEHKDETKHEQKTVETNHEHKHEHGAENKHEHAAEHKHEEKKESTKAHKPVVKKDLAVARSMSLHMSKRHGMYICSFIKNKKIDEAINDLEQVRLLKKAVPFKGEIPHRKGKGMMSGRYPITAAGLFIPILKSLKGNVTVNGMDLTKTRITSASATWASRPARRGGQKGKRTHIILEAREAEK